MERDRTFPGWVQQHLIVRGAFVPWCLRGERFGLKRISSTGWPMTHTNAVRAVLLGRRSTLQLDTATRPVVQADCKG
jgi:hypothetical protein